MLRARIVGVGASLPETVVGNEVLEKHLGLEPGWIEGRTGVRERRILREEEHLVDLAWEASRTAMQAAGVGPDQIDSVVVATTSGPYRFPSLACLLHERLGLNASPAFDVAAACAGFPYALSVADQAIRAGDHRCVLVVGADRLSALCEPGDRVTRPLFGDGAGAVVLAAEEQGEQKEPRGILATRLRALGELWRILYVRSGATEGAELPPQGQDRWMRMDGPEVFRAAVEQLVGLSREVLEVAGSTPQDVALVVPHQANLRIIRMMVTQLGVAPDRVVTNLERFGNTSAASIPIALQEAQARGRLREGDLLLVNAVGGGMTAGAVLVRW